MLSQAERDLHVQGTAPILRHGGHMPDVLAAADRQAPPSPQGELGGWEGYVGYVGDAAPQHAEAIVHIHWGICTWVPGQLDGASHSVAP